MKGLVRWFWEAATYQADSTDVAVTLMSTGSHHQFDYPIRPLVLLMTSPGLWGAPPHSTPTAFLLLIQDEAPHTPASQFLLLQCQGSLLPFA